MRVAFLTEHPADDIGAFSGIPFFMRRALSQATETLEVLTLPMPDLNDVLARNSLEPLRTAGDQASAVLEASSADYVVCQGSSMIPFLRTSKPVVLWHDSTWQSLLQTDQGALEYAYPALAEWDRRVVEVASAVIYAADWVRDDARALCEAHGCDHHVIPFGPSLFEVPAPQDSPRKAGNGRCRLVFVGIDWRRKGLPLAQAVTRELDRRGIATTLDVIGVPRAIRAEQWTGAAPFEQTALELVCLNHDPRVTLHGVLRKDVASESDRFTEIIRGADFLVHPAEFECFGVALVEANALGVPVVAPACGGPTSIVRDGVTGFLVDPAAFVEEAAERIAAIMSDGDAHRTMAAAARNEHLERLNWQTAAAGALEVLSRE